MPAKHCMICNRNFPPEMLKGVTTCPVCDVGVLDFDAAQDPDDRKELAYDINKAEFERRHGPADVDEYETHLMREHVEGWSERPATIPEVGS